MVLNTLPSKSDGRDKEEQEQEAEIRRDLFGTMQKVVVEGVEYLWNRKSRTQPAVLL
jgi:hypothetical protein